MAETVASEDAGLISPERLIYFSDAVIAIAITLLALELPTPEAGVHGNAEVLAFLREHIPAYLAFLISFGAVAMQWLFHQRLFRYATGLVGPVIQGNLVWLLMIVIMPFTTKMLTLDADAYQVQFTIYAANQALAGLVLLLVFRSLRRSGLLRSDTPHESIADTRDWVITVIAVFLISIPVAFVTQWASLSWVLLPLVKLVVRSVRHRR
jgi:uncharacterized membrane protein